MAVSPVVTDAEKRMIAQHGMPFPIVERPPFDVAKTFAEGESEQKRIPMSFVIATQRDLDADKVHSMMGAEELEPVQIVRDGNSCYLSDGHHRAAACKFNGDGSILADVVER